MKPVLAPLFAIVLCLSLLAGCSSKKPIVGKWQDDKGWQTEFTQDGKVRMFDQQGKVVKMGNVSSDSANYTLPDDGHFTMEIDLGGNKKIRTNAYKIDGDTLTIDEDGTKVALKRVK